MEPVRVVDPVSPTNPIPIEFRKSKTIEHPEVIIDPAKPNKIVEKEEINELKPETKTQNTFFKLKTYGGKCDILTTVKKEIKYQIDCLKKKDHNKTEGCTRKFKKPVVSTNSFGVIKSFGINSFTGFYKKHNEDRVSVVLNIPRPKSSNKPWPHHLSYFALFDGHSGNECCDFLINNFHKFLIKSTHFPEDIVQSLKDAVEKSETEFLTTVAVSKSNEIQNKSGSCALVTIIADNMCYIANVGDSRAILSSLNGKQMYQITHDHKPNEKKEKRRIHANGGVVYKANSVYRVIPGDLSVSRTIGDAEVKIPFLGGKEGVVVSTPEIVKFRIDEKYDFLLLGCDGIFDRTENGEIVKEIWSTLDDKNSIEETIHEQSGKSVDNVIKLALKQRSTDNLSAIIICFNSFEKAFINRKNDNY